MKGEVALEAAAALAGRWSRSRARQLVDCGLNATRTPSSCLCSISLPLAPPFASTASMFLTTSSSQRNSQFSNNALSELAWHFHQRDVMFEISVRLVSPNLAPASAWPRLSSLESGLLRLKLAYRSRREGSTTEA